MSIHKLTAGYGYEYLTRQVAALDATDKGHTGLASYYTERGETPGVWVGAGMAGIDGLSAGDVVTAEQMQALFGSGHHPLAKQRRLALERDGLNDGVGVQVAARAVTRLGAPFKVYSPDVSSFRAEVAKRVTAINIAAGLPADWPVPADQRSRVRTDVAQEFFVAEHGREPVDARELSGLIAQRSRPATTAVAGYDLTFSPVKSVSTLWAVADEQIAAQVELAHQAAVADALAFLERCALFTRIGANGVRQVDVRGLVATAFTHRDSRAGDPDLHTHVAVANKVQTLDGRWLAIDGRVLFKATVAASETYNTALEWHLRGRLGVRFEARRNLDEGKRPVREIVGIDARLNQRWSARRASIEKRSGELAAVFQAAHGRPPTGVEAIKLAQQATLETRDAKHSPRTLGEQRASWLDQAVELLGGRNRVQLMVQQAMSPPAVQGRVVVDAAWLHAAADRVMGATQRSRSTWQVWHVRAEAHRQVRAADSFTGDVEEVVDLLVDLVLDRSVSLARPSDGIAEPDPLRRVDGSSVYTVAGAGLYTSTRVLDAERRIVAAAGRDDGHRVDSATVELAVLEAAATGVDLNPGQASLVREMATSGKRVQLGIAPAGSGKTTAMRVLAAAWSNGGGTVLGLAPSATAAAALGEQLNDSYGTHTDTLAKLNWSLATGDLPQWVDQVDERTLVVIDEAGMADTLSLDTAIGYVLDRGGSVRLIGDDQQLTAIGAGGVLRDIQATYGCLRLSELLRFADAAEAAASLALRDGRLEALGFYLDHHRVHVGALTANTDAVFNAWQADKAHALDSIMLAPTRELVAELNQRARMHRLNGVARSEPAVRLSDGNLASVGDIVLTRSNDRRLRTSASDWVKNGDRWTVLAVGPQGDLAVQHARNGRSVALPSQYVQTSTELGYAATVHTAQGVTVDTVHGLVTGAESRQQLYTMLTRGRAANHIYVEVVGDGDPHQLIRPDLMHPPTATELLERILARDDAPSSATTTTREHADPYARLGQATGRYLDALYAAVEHVAEHELVARLNSDADTVVPGLTDAPAWLALRAHLLLLAAAGADPVTELSVAADHGELNSAADKAAVIDWRLDDTGLRHAGPGPLPWMPAVPATLRAHQQWGAYLGARAAQVRELADQVRSIADAVDGGRPTWASEGLGRLPVDVRADVSVWRSAMNVGPTDRRPTGPRQLQKAAARWQARLDARVIGDRTPAWVEWRHLISQAAPRAQHDAYAPILAERLAAVSRAGLDAAGLLRDAATAGALPDDHACAALWWRISGHLSPTVATPLEADESLHTGWSPRLIELVGADRARSLQASPWWPTLVTTVDHALARGWRLEDLMTGGAAAHVVGEDDQCQLMVWRLSMLADPNPRDEPPEPTWDPPPADMWEVADAAEPPCDKAVRRQRLHGVIAADPEQEDPARPVIGADVSVAAGLYWAARQRGLVGLPEQNDADEKRMLERAWALDQSPIPQRRLLEVNALSRDYYQQMFPASWGRRYLVDRFGVDLAGHPGVQPGHAPAGWTHLVHYLRRRGVTDEEMLACGVAAAASTGRLIDRFRDRVVFPILHRGQVLGFVARRHPDAADDTTAGPKYLNTAGTVVFHKGAQLFGGDMLGQASVPVLVEGPMDAIAVSIATAGSHVGVAPLGTSMTDEQAAQLGRLGINPVVATDADLAGHVAAERAFWRLTPYTLDPTYARLPNGLDPADMLTRRGPDALRDVLTRAQPLGDILVHERLNNLPRDQATTEAVRVLAARASDQWRAGADRIAALLQVPVTDVQRHLLTAVHTWDRDPREAAQNVIHSATGRGTGCRPAATPPFSRRTPSHGSDDQPLPSIRRERLLPHRLAAKRQGPNARPPR